MKKIQSLFTFLNKKKSSSTFLFVSFVISIPVLFYLFVYPFCSVYFHQKMVFEEANLAPSTSHFFGTDMFGRDMAVRIALSAHLSLAIAGLATIFKVIIGFIWGATAALGGKKWDIILVNFADILLSLPNILVIILIVVVLGNNPFALILGMVMTGWIVLGKIIRGHFQRLQLTGFVIAAQSLGASPFHIFFKHLLPNIRSPIIPVVSLAFQQSLLAESVLSFMGVGLQPPHVSLGYLVREGGNSLNYYPWQFFFPALILFFIFLIFIFLAEGLKKSFENF
ncbi:Oligopeptide transport system permease protein OppC [Candidatus Clavichlamydia salmonicola]|uniref:ABC transporter permease n=1 Tax=Candidatus Clavichlamydia salmonicola TaxID=469812 RepID=UPI0018914410|nr:ABC transporter permease [Candidatus Clavichlamydia salmonicola]MBF5051176.1 Oligopeptide transport system permease protein OppC [Candidatus Clavichlamydia salmonicola]